MTYFALHAQHKGRIILYSLSQIFQIFQLFIYRIKSNSCLKQLQHFHLVNGLPPDLDLDLLEGFAKDVLNIVIIRWLQQKYFTIDVIPNFSYSDIEKKNKS